MQKRNVSSWKGKFEQKAGKGRDTLRPSFTVILYKDRVRDGAMALLMEIKSDGRSKEGAKNRQMRRIGICSQDRSFEAQYAKP